MLNLEPGLIVIVGFIFKILSAKESPISIILSPAPEAIAFSQLCILVSLLLLTKAAPPPKTEDNITYFKSSIL